MSDCTQIGAAASVDEAETVDVKSLEDAELVAECLNWNSAAWEELVLRYQRLIYSIPIKMGMPQEEAADVFQSICLRLIEKLDTLRDHDRLASWITTATVRECWRRSATRRREISTAFEGEEVPGSETPTSGVPLPIETQIALQLQQLVRQSVDALPERCRRLVTLLFYEKELSYAEVAQAMGMPVASIGPTRARCLQKLRKSLEGKL